MWWPFSRGYPTCSPKDIDFHAYDYVVIGGGTAGSVVAARLSEDPNVSVLLLERGQANDTWLSRIPLLAQGPLPGIGYNYLDIEPMEYANRRQDLKLFKAEVLGGNTRINGLIYQRGSVADYDNWAALGHPNWSYEAVQPFFVKSERSLDQPKSSYRGTEGPWTTRKNIIESMPFRWYEAFHKSAVAVGFPPIADANSPHAPCDGVATFDMTVNEHMERMSSSRAFLPIEVAHARKGHLTICPNMLVTRIEFSGNKESKRAERVHFQPNSNPKSGQLFSVRINREAILSSGAFGSPQLLMLSGIGPQEHLAEIGIPVVHDLPGVGSHLHDHPSISVSWEVPVAESLGILLISVWVAIFELLKYVFFRVGMLTLNSCPVSLFVRASSIDEKSSQLIGSNPSDVTKILPEKSSTKIQKVIPDIEIIAIASPVVEDAANYIKKFPKIGVVSLFCALLQPVSRGSVRLASSNPLDQPKVNLGYFSDSADYRAARKAIRLALKCAAIMRAQGFPLLGTHTDSVPEDPEDDESVDNYVRKKVRSIYHYTSTCRMAPIDDPLPGVVNDELQVHSVTNLRVADASIFPNVLATHMQAPTVMVAERCADFIKRRWAKGED